MSEDEKASVRSAVDKLKETVKGNDTEAIKADTQALEQAFYKLSEKLYADKQAGAQAGGAQADGGAQPGDDGTINTDFEDKTDKQ